MKRIAWGILIALGPVLTAGLGALMVKIYGRSTFAELLQWGLPLLLLSIPLGAALVVSGAVRMLAEYRARRAAGITDRRI